MAVQVITDNDSIYDYWYEDGQLYGRRKSNKIPFKINSDKANSIIFPQVQAKGVDPTKPTSTLVYHPAKYKEMPTAKKISTPKQKEETMWERGKQLINLVGNGLSRKLQLFFDSEPEHTSKRIKIPNKKVTKNKRRENLELEISPDSYTINDTTNKHKAYFQMNFNHSEYLTSDIDNEVNNSTLVGAINITNAYRLVNTKPINEYIDVSLIV